MTNRQRTEPPESSLLGMIVDHSSFDKDEKDDDLMSLAEDSRRKIRNGKVRRKLRWKPAAFRTKNQPKPSTHPHSDSASVFSNRTNKSNASCHTFHSTETPVQSNKTTKAPIQLGRPHNRDTFEGVATIANEGHFIHAKTMRTTGLLRAKTLPNQTKNNFDLQSMDGESYSTGDLNSVPLVFDPFGLEQRPKQPTLKQNNATINTKAKTKSNTQTKTNVPRPKKQSSESPPLPPRKRLLKSVSLGEAPVTPRAALERTQSDLPLKIQDNWYDDRQVSYFNQIHEMPGTLGISPIKIPQHVSPFVSPSTTPVQPGQPPNAPQRVTSLPSPPKPQNLMNTQSLLNVMMTSGQLQGCSLHNMPLTSAAATQKLYHRPVDAPRLHLGSKRREAPETVVGTPAVVRPSKPRNQTGPADVDEGSFVEAELHLKAIHDMAAKHLAHGEYEEALEVFEEILRGQVERYGGDHYRVGTALHNVGIVHLKSGNYMKAVEIYQLAVKVRKHALAPNHPDVAVLLAQLGVAQLECKRYRNALVAFRDALSIRRECLGPRHPKVGKILNNVGCALYELDELEGARLAFEEALEIQRESLRSSPVNDDATETKSSSNQILLSIAATLCNIGSIKVRWSKFEEASVALEEALLVSDPYCMEVLWILLKAHDVPIFICIASAICSW